MTVYDIPNIEHCDVSKIGSIGYRILVHEGWYIHQRDFCDTTDENGNPTKLFRTVALLSTGYDFSLVEITAEADLPENAEICGGNNDHEKM